MDFDELNASYFHDALNLAQTSLYTGVSIAVGAYIAVIYGKNEGIYTIPILNIETSSVYIFSLLLAVIFFLCGMYSSYGVFKAISSRRAIGNPELSMAILEAPYVLLSPIYFKGFAYGLITMISGGLLTQVLGIEGNLQLLSALFLCSPYFVALTYSNDLYLARAKPSPLQ
jgi:hypothetical protein